MSSSFTRRRFIRGMGAAAALAAGGGNLAGSVAWGQGLTQSRAPGHISSFAGLNFPRAIWFRHAEDLALDLNYPDFEQAMLRLDGVVAKVLPDDLFREPADNLRLIDYFTTFKGNHPDVPVLYHFDAGARRPFFRPERFFAGHWLYLAGTQLTQPAGPADSVLHVDDASIFRLDVGRFRNLGDDIGIALTDANGSPDWNQAEQVKLVDRDVAAKTITVNRNRFGTTPMALPAGTYLAPHQVQGPWGPCLDPENLPPTALLTWVYNFSTACPTDSEGRNCIDALVESLVDIIGPGGDLELFDGVQFDVFFFDARSTYHAAVKDANGDIIENGTAADVDTDGVIDEGILNGINTYGEGTVEFAQRMRDAFPNRTFIADGGFFNIVDSDLWSGVRQRPDFTAWNGIESEGWPNGPVDNSLERWSSGLNALTYWMAHSASPADTYINHRYSADLSEVCGAPPDITYSLLRASAAAAQMTGSVFGINPPPDEGVILDELVRGTDDVSNWLGQPTADAVRVALQEPDILNGQGFDWPQGFIDRFQGDDLTFTRIVNPNNMRAAVRVESSLNSAEPPLDREMLYALPDVDIQGPDLVIRIASRGAPIQDHAPEVSRQLRIWVEGPSTGLLQATFVNQVPFHAMFYFRDLAQGRYSIKFAVEGDPWYIMNRMTIHEAPDVMYRVFENGVVFVNPGNNPYTFGVGSILGGQQLRRIAGSASQDPVTNDGQIIGASLTLPANDGLFTIRE